MQPAASTCWLTDGLSFIDITENQGRPAACRLPFPGSFSTAQNDPLVWVPLHSMVEKHGQRKSKDGPQKKETWFLQPKRQKPLAVDQQVAGELSQFCVFCG